MDEKFLKKEFVCFEVNMSVFKGDDSKITGEEYLKISGGLLDVIIDYLEENEYYFASRTSPIEDVEEEQE